jgi:hypothetical protein
VAQNDSRKFLLFIYVALAIYLLPMFPHGGSANELTRWATAASLIEKGSFEISWTEDLIGKNVDTAIVDGKSYSNKAPGTAVIAAPIYGLTRLFIGPPNASNIRVSWFAMRFVIATLPLLLFAFWLYRREADEFALAALLFTTPLFLYSILFFSHVFVAALIYFAFRFLYDNRVILPRNCLYAGVLSGLAVVSEFPAIFAVVVFGAGLLFTEKRDRFNCLSSFALGGAPFAIFLLIYNYSIFGSPFSMSYAHESFPEWAEVAGQGVFGIGFPTLSNAFLLLFSPSRGLFFTAPILLLSVVCFFTSRERNTLRHRVKVAAIVFSILILCGHGAAHGGWAFGPRYLIFIIPLLLDSLIDGETYEFSNIWQGFLFTVSFLLCTLPALTFPFAPPEFRFPHNGFWAAFITGEQWFTPNLGNVFGLNGIWSILPVLLLFLVVLLLVGRHMRRPQRFGIGMLAGIVVFCGYIFWPGLGNTELDFRQATIAERYFKPADRLEPFRRTALTSGDWPTLRRVNDFDWNIADTRAFAPNDFPYLDSCELSPSPSAQTKKAILFQQQGKFAESEQLLKDGKEAFPRGKCEFSSNLAVIYYTTNRKDIALQELESVQPLVNKASRPDCLRSQFLLGSLYQELGRIDESRAVLDRFLTNSADSVDNEINKLRQNAARR